MTTTASRKSDELIFDGKGYVTPLQSAGLEFLRRDISALPRAPQYPKLQKKPFAPRPPLKTSPKGERSLSLQLTSIALLTFCGFTALLYTLFFITGTIKSPIEPLETGIEPVSGMTVVIFAIYAFGGLFTGVGVCYWWVRSTQN